MTLRAVARFEFAYQARRIAPWLYAALLFLAAWSIIQGNYLDDARNGFVLLNAPLVVASTTVVACLLWLFIGASVAGDAAARDVDSGMHPLSYSAPVSKRTYLAGRFMAAYALNALILLAVPAGMWLGMHWPAVEPGLLGPWRPAAFVLAYAVIVLPNAFIATAVQFAFAALARRAIVGYFGSVVLFAASMGLAGFVAVALREQDLARLLDPVGMIAIVSHLSDTWTTGEANTRLVGLQPLLLANRLLWLVVGAAVLAASAWRFRLAHPAEGRLRLRRRKARAALQAAVDVDAAPVRPPAAGDHARSFGFAMQLRQLLAVTARALRALARGWTLLPPLAVVALLACIVLPVRMQFLDVPLVPRTWHVLTYLTAALADPGNRVWMLVPLLVVFYAGELVWGERDARMGELTGAAPVPEWVAFLARFLALALVLAAWMLVLLLCGVVAQAALGYPRFEPGVYVQVLLGLQLADYLLFALLALAVHTLVDHKHLGTLVALALYALIAFAPMLGLEHRLLVFGASPGWWYSDIRGFGATLLPWLAFKAYWVAWAGVLAVLARLAWVRGRDLSAGTRWRLARARLTRPTLLAAALCGAAVLGLGATILHNTHGLNHYRSQAAQLADRAAYERRYARYARAPQPRLAATRLQVDLDPQRRTAALLGSYRLVNGTGQAIDTVHVAMSTRDGVRTRRLAFDRPATRVLDDPALGHRIYRLAAPLQPGEVLGLAFDVAFAPQGFGNGGADDSIVANGSWLQTADILPAIGYQPARELRAAGDRLTHGLPARPEVPPLDDAEARRGVPGQVGMQLDAIVSTTADQVAIAPGVLRRSWRQGGRRYFHYATEAPIREHLQVFSGRYAVERRPCHGVEVEVFHHPTHRNAVASIANGACAALGVYARRFVPYPRRTLRFVENAKGRMGAHSEPGLVDYGEGFALLDPASAPEGLDLVFAVAAHEVAHQWWGAQLAPARVEGAGLLVESLATYSATQVVQAARGDQQLQAYLDMMRREYEVPRSRAAPPLIRAADDFLYYRKGPLALYALAQYAGRDQVNLALRRLLRAHPPGSTPLATARDLYRELQVITPARYRTLLHDLLAANTYWELAARQARATRLADGRWQVAIDLRARKLVVDADGAEVDRPLDEWVEIGVYPGAVQRRGDGQPALGQPMLLRKVHVDAGTQTITVVVPTEPGHVGVDPRNLLVDLRPLDNVVAVTGR